MLTRTFLLLAAVLLQQSSAFSLRASRQLQDNEVAEDVVYLTTPCDCACDLPDNLIPKTGIAMVQLQVDEAGEDTNVCVTFDESIDFSDLGTHTCNDYCFYIDDKSYILGDGIGEEFDGIPDDGEQ